VYLVYTVFYTNALLHYIILPDSQFFCAAKGGMGADRYIFWEISGAVKTGNDVHTTKSGARMILF
jgi:hypothetical protein